MVRQFFNGENWDEIFPQLLNHQQTLYSLRNGLYGVFVDPDGSITVSTETDAGKVDEYNVVFAYKYKGEASSRSFSF